MSCSDCSYFDKKDYCSLLKIKVVATANCPGHTTRQISDNFVSDIPEGATVIANGNGPIRIINPVTKVTKKRNKSARCIVLQPDDSIKNVTLFNHQKAAFEKYKDSNIIPLFFSMGCGKTITILSIAKYKYQHEMINGILVVAPNDVHKQWYDDIVNPSPEVGKVFEMPIEIQCIGGRGGAKELAVPNRPDLMQIIIVNVDTFSTPTKWKDIVDWCNMFNYMLIIDEATVIKNPSSNRSQRLLYEFNDVIRKRNTVISNKKKDTSLCRAALTGTPSTNGPMDLWAIMEFIEPNYFNRNYYSFKAYYGMHTALNVEDASGHVRTVQVALTEKTWDGIKNCTNYQEAFVLFGCSEDTYMTIQHQDRFEGPYKHADELKALLNKHATFVQLVDCVDMPVTNYISKEVGMNAEQKAAYRDMRNELLVLYNDHMSTAKNQLTAAMRLAQISSGFIMGQSVDIDLTDEASDVMPNEVVWLGNSNPKLDQLLRDVAELDKPLLILTRFSAEAAKIYDLLKDTYRTMLFTGWKVVGSMEEFKAGKYDIMVANSAKVSRGFNLQIAHNTIFYSNSFSMEIRQQAEFRTFRIGQKYPCSYIDYIGSDIDRTVTESLRIKKRLLDYLRSDNIEEAV